MRDTRVQSLGRDHLLEREMVIHSSILAWRIPWMEEPGGLQSTGSQRVGQDSATSLHYARHSEGPDIVKICSLPISEHCNLFIQGEQCIVLKERK